MADKPELEALLERVRAATGPDRELDDAIAAVVGGWHRGSFDWYDHVGKRRNQSPTFTRSVDSCLALIKRVLPGWRITLIEMMSNWQAHLNLADASGFVIDDVFEDGATDPLALITALLLALLHQTSDKEMTDAE